MMPMVETDIHVAFIDATTLCRSMVAQ